MAYVKKPGVTAFHVDCSIEAKMRFDTLHEAMGFKTKSESFEAILYAVSNRDQIDPERLERIERKLDQCLERFDTLL